MRDRKIRREGIRENMKMYVRKASYALFVFLVNFNLSNYFISIVGSCYYSAYFYKQKHTERNSCKYPHTERHSSTHPSIHTTSTHTHTHIKNRKLDRTHAKSENWIKEGRGEKKQDRRALQRECPAPNCA